MNTFSSYPIFFGVLAVGAIVIWGLRFRGVSWTTQATAGVLICLLIAIFSFRMSDPPLGHPMFLDFTNAYYPAGKSIIAGDHAAGLVESIRRGNEGFVNLPVLAWLLAPFGLLESSVAAILFLLLGVACTIAAWYLLVRLTNLNRERSLLLLFVFSANGPLHYSLKIGNSTHFVLLLLVLGIWALRKERGFVAGVIFGLAALIKLPLLLIGIYFAARGKWRVAFGGAAICCVAGLMSLLMFGWEVNYSWYEHSIKPYSELPVPAYNVQSIQGFFARLQFREFYLMDWSVREVDSHIRIASKVAVYLLMLMAATVMFLPKRFRRGRTLSTSPSAVIEMELCIVIMLAMAVSMVSWSHYYLWLLLPAAYVIAGTPPALGVKGVRIAAVIALIGSIPPVMIMMPQNPIFKKAYSYLAVSHYLISVLLLIAVFLYARWKSEMSKEESSDA